MGSEQGQIHSGGGGGSWWVGPSSPFVVVGAGVALSLLAVLVVCWSPGIVHSLSFICCRCHSSVVVVIRLYCIVGIWHRSVGEG